MRRPNLVEVALIMSIIAMLYLGVTAYRQASEIARLRKSVLDGMEIPGRDFRLYNGIYYDHQSRIVYCATPSGGHIYELPPAITAQ